MLGSYILSLFILLPLTLAMEHRAMRTLFALSVLAGICIIGWSACFA